MKRLRRVIAKVEWHAGELFPRVGFIVTNMSSSPEAVVPPDNGKPDGMEVRWRGRSASMPQNPVNRARKAEIVLEYRRWRRHVGNTG